MALHGDKEFAEMLKGYPEKVKARIRAEREKVLLLVVEMRQALENNCHDCNLRQEPYCVKQAHDSCTVPKLITRATAYEQEGK